MAPETTSDAQPKPAAGAGPGPSVGLWLLAMACLAVRLPWIFTVPMSEAPDEFAHYWVIRFIREHWRLPSALEVAAGGPSAVYGSLPQLGYLPHLIVSSLFPADAVSLAARFGSLAMGLVTLWAGYRLGAELFPGKRLLSLAVPCLLVFHPQLVFLHSYANNDSTSSALAALVLYLLVLTLKHGLTLRRSALIGALLGWIALSKYAGLAIFPVVFVACLTAAFLHRANRRLVLASFLIMVSLCLCVDLWWFLRNYQEFAGDWLGTKTMYRTWAVTFHRDLNFHMRLWQVIKQSAWWHALFFSFWGLFGYMNRYLWRPVYAVYLGFLITAVLGFIKDAIRPARLQRTRVSTAVWLTLAFSVAVNLTAMIFASSTNLGGPQGRYLFTSEIPVLALTVAGLARLGKSGGYWLVSALIAFNAAVCLGSWLMLFSTYGWHLRPY